MKLNLETHLGTVFVSFGFFWLSLVMIWLLPELGHEEADKMSTGVYLLTFGSFTLFLFIISLNHIKVLQVLFALVTVSFFLLAIVG